MNKWILGFVAVFVMSSFTLWADQTAPASTPAVVATPKPMPPDVKAARDKWLNAKTQEVQAGHDFDALKRKYQMQNEQKCLSDAQAKKNATKSTKYQARIDALNKIQTDKDQILSLQLDQINNLKADDKTDAMSDTDQIKSLQDDIKAQWQLMK